MSRPLVRVAAGVLLAPDGRYLACQRPEGKIAAGKWEFPGGKIEAGESPEQALHRELREELGISVQVAQPLIRICHAYTDRDVQMWVYAVSAWQGRLHPHDGQNFGWFDLEGLGQLDLLGADGPILRALALPPCLPLSPETASLTELIRLGRAWAAQGWTLARLRLPTLGEADYGRLAEKLIAEAAVGWILDRSPDMSMELGAAGWHASAVRLRHLTERPVSSSTWFGASVHSKEAWLQARAVGADYALLSPVCPTLTHPDRQALGWKGFAEVVSAGNLPTYALGGLGSLQVGQAQLSWGQGVSGIRAFAEIPTE